MRSENLENNSKVINNSKEEEINKSPKAVPIADIATKLLKSAKISPDNSSQKYRNFDEPYLEDDRITKSKITSIASDKKLNSKNLIEEIDFLERENAEENLGRQVKVVENNLKESVENKEEAKAEVIHPETTELKISTTAINFNENSFKDSSVKILVINQIPVPLENVEDKANSNENSKKEISLPKIQTEEILLQIASKSKTEVSDSVKSKVNLKEKPLTNYNKEECSENSKEKQMDVNVIEIKIKERILNKSQKNAPDKIAEPEDLVDNLISDSVKGNISLYS
jgi:hypothetical protein